MEKIIAFILSTCLLCTAAAGEDRSESGPSKGNTNVMVPTSTERYEYHEVCGCCEKDVQCEMMDKAIRWKDGNKYDSLTKWKMKWDYGHVRRDGACFADSFRVDVEITYHLPKWVCAGHAPQALADKWDRYIKNLNLHEHGHGDKAVKAADELTRSVAEAGPASSCVELDRKIEHLCQERMQRLDREQEEYDAATGNGQKQGAAFP